MREDWNAALESRDIVAQAVQGPRGVVAAQHRIAAEAGAAMLDAGGTAVDAIVATAYALAVCEPWMCGPGGSGLAVVWQDGRAHALDFQGCLPRAADPRDYPVDPALPPTPMGFPAVVGRANTEGYRSITVPGAVAGFETLLNRYGRLPLTEVMAPAIALARTGLRACWFTTLQVAVCARVLARDPVSAAIWLPGGHPVLPETRVRVPGLADTLEEIAATGARGFYRGALARRIVADLNAGGSAITTEDFAAYRVIDVAPMHAMHRGTDLWTPGRISGGERQRDMLAHVAAALPDPPPRPDAESWLAYARGLDLAWAAHKRRNGVVPEVGGCTSSMAAVDGAGRMVALTYTLLNRFGAGVTLPGTGLLMNDAVSYFDPRPGLPTSIRGGARIASSNMSPTILTRNGQAVAALGAAGGDLIMPAVAQVAALMCDFGMSLAEALHHPRIDASARGSVRADPRLGPEVLAALETLHGRLELAQPLAYPRLYACVTGVARDPATGLCTGVCDPAQPMGGAAAPRPFASPAETPDQAPIRA